MMSRADLTVIIPTLRPALAGLLGRELRDCGFRVIVAPSCIDESEVSKLGPLETRSAQDLYQRISKALTDVQTEYSMLLADDFFVFVKTLDLALEALGASPELVVVTGGELMFRLGKRGPRVFRHYQSHLLDHHHFRTPGELRIRELARPHRSALYKSVYGVYRTTYLRSLITALLRESEMNMVEREVLWGSANLLVAAGRHLERPLIAELVQLRKTGSHLRSDDGWRRLAVAGTCQSAVYKSFERVIRSLSPSYLDQACGAWTRIIPHVTERLSADKKQVGEQNLRSWIVRRITRASKDSPMSTLWTLLRLRFSNQIVRVSEFYYLMRYSDRMRQVLSVDRLT